jgi:hypothetical protein
VSFINRARSRPKFFDHPHAANCVLYCFGLGQPINRRLKSGSKGFTYEASNPKFSLISRLNSSSGLFSFIYRFSITCLCCSHSQAFLFLLRAACLPLRVLLGVDRELLTAFVGCAAAEDGVASIVAAMLIGPGSCGGISAEDGVFAPCWGNSLKTLAPPLYGSLRTIAAYTEEESWIGYSCTRD